MTFTSNNNDEKDGGGIEDDVDDGKFIETKQKQI